MAVSAIVLEAGGDEDLAIAALLHDAVEDRGGPPTLKTIRRMFGERVANVVMECSDTDREPKPPWRERKEQYLAHLSSASSDALLVSIADKLHNARSVLADYRRHKENLWMRFNFERTGSKIWTCHCSRIFPSMKREAFSSGPRPSTLQIHQHGEFRSTI